MKLALAALVTLLCIVAHSRADTVKVLSEAAPITIFPKNIYGKTRYDLITCKGCKIIMLCTFKVTSAENADITVLNGDSTVKYTPQSTPMFNENSLHNEMTVIFNNEYPMRSAECQLQATISYMDFIEPKIDSREHGLIRKGRKKNTCKCGWTNKSPGRIVGGKDASVNEYSFPVILRLFRNRMPFCGGSIITAYHVLTAAHCTNPLKNISIIAVVGDHDLANAYETQYTKEHLVTRVFQHPGFDTKSKINDISILEVAPKIIFNDVIGPVCLPTKQYNLQEEFIKVMGWGLIADRSKGGKPSRTMKKVNLKVIDPRVCESIFYGFKHEVQVCSYNYKKGTCSGDSGGPVVQLNPETNTYNQVALVSYGDICGTTAPNVHTDVGHFLPWIKEQISRSNVDAELCF